MKDPAHTFTAEDEGQLRQQLAEYRAILENASLGITFTRDRRFMHCNPRFSEMFGWPAEELEGQPTEIVYPSAEAFAEIGRIAGPILSGGERLDVEVQFRRRDGSLFWARMMAKAVDAQDPAKGTIFITEDITERRATQAALQRANEELEQRVRERTAELAKANFRLEQEIRERHQMEEQVRHLANHDALTDLPNRRLLQDRLDRAMTTARRNAQQVGVMFMDLDHFKPINDRLGHRIGDQLLRAVAQRLRMVLREVDTVSRVGGDEFVLVLPDLRSRTDVLDIADRVIEAMVQPYEVEHHQLQVTPSIGIALYPQDADDADVLISCADTAMYRAKKLGRQNYQFYEAKTSAEAVRA